MPSLSRPGSLVATRWCCGWRRVGRDVGRLADAKNYSLHTTRATGAPDAVPVWGVKVADILYIYSERSTVKARNLERDPRVVIHLESGADVVIVHGRFVDLGLPTDHPEVVEAFDRKYCHPVERPFLTSSDPAFDVLYSLEPRRALMWSPPDTEASTRRLRSDQRGDPRAPGLRFCQQVRVPIDRARLGARLPRLGQGSGPSRGADCPRSSQTEIQLCPMRLRSSSGTPSKMPSPAINSKSSARAVAATQRSASCTFWAKGCPAPCAQARSAAQRLISLASVWTTSRSDSDRANRPSRRSPQPARNAP